MKITTFDKTNCKVLRAAMDEALVAVGKTFGLVLKAGNMSMCGQECTAQFQSARARL